MARRLRVAGVSLGSPGRDFTLDQELGGRLFLITRQGTAGDLDRAAGLIASLDGRVDSIGLGGINLYLADGRRRYPLREGMVLAGAARSTPLADGGCLKASYERSVPRRLVQGGEFAFSGKLVLLVSGLDRFGLAQGLLEVGARVLLADPLFALGVPLVFGSLTAWQSACRVAVPLLSQLPIRLLYPLGAERAGPSGPCRPAPAGWLARRLFRQVDVIAGDFHFIKKHLPADLRGKVVLTSTLTGEDREVLRACGAGRVITLYPQWRGRAPGANIVEAVVCAYLDKGPGQIGEAELPEALRQLGIEPSSQRPG